MIDNNPQLPNNIVFSDEATFELSGNDTMLTYTHRN